MRLATATTERAWAGRVDPPSPAGRRVRVRVPQLTVGLLLTAGAALAFVLYLTSTMERVAVLALATDVTRGQLLALEDLRVVHVATDDMVALTAADQSHLLIGRAAVTDLSVGTLVTVEQVADAATLVPGFGVVGLSLAPGQYPTPRLRIADLVNVVEVASGGVLVEAAEVVDVAPVGTQGQLFVSLLTAEDRAGEVAAAAASGEVRLVLIARDRPTPDEREVRP